MLKTLIKTLIIGGFLGMIIAVAVPFIQKPTLIVPFPYKFAPNSYKQQDPKAPILILGDRMGKRLYEYGESLSRVLSRGLEEPIKIQSWAKDGDGFHRVLHKLSRLKTIPKVVIFHGLSQEFLEPRFNISEIDPIQINFDLFEQQAIKNAIFFLPVSSRYIYEKFKVKEFTKTIIPFQPGDNHSKKELVTIQALTYKLLEFELDAFISKLKSNGSLLVLVSTPINYKISPQKACSSSVSDEIKEKINSAEDYIQRGLLKQALLELESDSLSYVPNPYYFYLKAKVHQTLGENYKALKMYQKAVSFDCKFWRTNPVFNAILEQKAREHGVLFFDFAKMLDDDFFVNETFADELYPQELYYEKLTKALGKQLKRILRL